MNNPPNSLLVPTPETTHHVSWCFRSQRGTPTRWADMEES